MNHKKFLSLLLAICMVLAMLPTVALAEGTVNDELTRDKTGVTGSSYTDWTYTSTESGAVYAGQSAGGNSSIQLRSSGNSGIVTTTSGGKAKTIKVTWEDHTYDGRTLNVYGKNSAYTAVSDLYGDNAGKMLGTIVKGTSTELTISGDYEYIGMRSAGSAMYLTNIEITWSTDSEVPPVTTYTVSFDANGGTGTMANVTTASPYTLPTCGFTAPEGKEFEGWKIDGGDTLLAVGTAVELTADTTFVAQWKDLPVATYTNMMLKRVPANGDTVVVYYPAAGKVMTGESYYYNNKKYELAAADATLTDNVLAVPAEAVRLTVSVSDGKYTFATADGKYLEADGTNVQLVSAQSANTLFQLETAAAGTDNYYIKCDSATYNGNAQYIEYYGGYFTVYSLNTSNTPIFTFQFFSEDGEGPTPETTYTVTLNPGDAEGEPQTIEDVTSPYTLPDCPFTAPEGKVFNGWQAADGTVYAAGAQVTLEGNATFTATWKELEARIYELVTSAEGLVDGGTYLIASEVSDVGLYLMSKQTSNNRAQYGVTGVEGTTLTLDSSWIAANAADDLAFEFTLEAEGNNWAFHDEVTGGYLYAAGNETNKKNWLRTETELDDNGKFSITFEDDGATVPVAQGENTRGYMHYNGESACFSCYAEDSHITGAVYLYKLVEDAPATKPTFQNQSLILDGKIGLSFNMELPEIAGVDYDTSYMTFGVEHGTCTERVDYSAAKLRKSGTKAFVCYVTAIMMAEPITATFHYMQDGTEKTVEKTYAITEYFDAFDATLQDDPNAYDQKTITLVHALADYGYYMLTYLKGLKGLTYAEMTKVYTESYNYEAIAGELEDYELEAYLDGTDFGGFSFSVLFDSDTSLKLLLTPVAGFSGTVTAAEGDNTPVSVTKSGKRYVLMIANLPAHKLSKTFNITVTTVETGDPADLSVSVLSYANLILQYSEAAAAKNAACAIYCYSAAADAYKAGN